MITKENFKQALEEIEKEGKIIFVIGDIMKKAGYKNISTCMRHPRRIMKDFIEEGLVSKKIISNRCFYFIDKNYKIRLPFFEKPIEPEHAQIFIDKFYHEISEIVSDKVGSSSFSLSINDNHLCAIKKEKVML